MAWWCRTRANERILKAVSKRVGIPYDKFVMTICKYGNTSAASVSMALGWAAEEGIFADGDKIIFCSVGAGLTFAGGLLVCEFEAGGREHVRSNEKSRLGAEPAA